MPRKKIMSNYLILTNNDYQSSTRVCTIMYTFNQEQIIHQSIDCHISIQVWLDTYFPGERIVNIIRTNDKADNDTVIDLSI